MYFFCILSLLKESVETESIDHVKKEAEERKRLSITASKKTYEKSINVFLTASLLLCIPLILMRYMQKMN